MRNNLKHYTLENGLNIYFYKDDKKHSTYVSLVVKYGGLKSDFKINNEIYHIEDGMQHFLEHLLLEKSQYGNLMTLFGEKQMRCNGITSSIRTNYYFDTVDNLDFGIEKLIKGINMPFFSSEDIEETKKPIYQEIRMSNDNKNRRAYNITLKNSFNTIPFNTVLGSIENIEKLTYDKAKLCYDTFYQPKNEFIVVVGNFDEEHILKLIMKCFDEIDRKYEDFELIKFDEKDEVVKAYEEHKMPVGRTLSYITYKIPISNIIGYHKLELELVLNYFLDLNFSTVSPTYKKLLDEKVIYDKIGFYSAFYLDFAFVTVYSTTNDANKFVSKIQEVFNGDFNNDQEAFELIKKNKKINLIGRFDDIVRLASSLIDNIVTFDYDKLDKVEDIDKVTYQKYLDLISKIKFNNYTVVKIEDKK